MQSDDERFPPEGQAYVSINTSQRGGVFRNASVTDALGGDSIQTSEEIKKYHTQQSRHLPNWAWFLLAKSLGIKLHENDKPWFGTLLHVLTLSFCIGYMITNTWFIGYDIYSLYTKQTLLTGTVNMLVGMTWCAMGVYANLTAGNLFSNKKFRECVRMHTKTILKISAATVMAIMATTVVVLNVVRNVDTFKSETCHGLVLGLNEWICHVRFTCHAGISFFTLVWNLLVGFVMLSVCRTHTIGLRRFIKILEEDGKAYMMYKQKIAAAQAQYMTGPASQHGGDSYYYDPLDEDQYMWDDDLTILSDSDFIGMPGPHHTPSHNVNIPTQRAQGTGEHSLPSSLPQGFGLSASQDEQYYMARPRQISQSAPHGSFVRGRRPTNRQTSTTDDELEDQDAKQRKGKKIASHRQQPQQQDEPHLNPVGDIGNNRKERSEDRKEDQDSLLINMEEDGDDVSVTCSMEQTRSPSTLRKRASCQSEAEIDVLMSKILTNEDILVSYWRISSRLRATSLAMQRWLASWIFFVSLWSANYVIYWLSHPATVAGILEVVIPLCLLPLVCSAFAEVNNEAIRLVKCVCPTSERLGLLSYLEKYPLEMTLFGYPLSYGDILKVILAFALAFSSRFILDEVFPGGQVPTAAPPTTTTITTTVASMTDVVSPFNMSSLL